MALNKKDEKKDVKEPAIKSEPGKLVYAMDLEDGRSFELTAKDMPEMIEVGRAKCKELGVSPGKITKWQRI